MPYRERLLRPQLHTIKFRRTRGDMIEVFKILTGKYDIQVSSALGRSIYGGTRGHSLKLNTVRSKYDLRKYSFTNRIVNICNSLPEDIVGTDSVNSFKNRLDKCWKNEGMYFNYESELTGTQQVFYVCL